MYHYIAIMKRAIIDDTFLHAQLEAATTACVAREAVPEPPQLSGRGVIAPTGGIAFR